MDVGEIAFLGLIIWRTCWNICWIDRNILSLHHKVSLQARTRQLLHSQGDPSAVTASQAMTACQILYPQVLQARTDNHKPSFFTVLF